MVTFKFSPKNNIELVNIVSFDNISTDKHLNLNKY